MPTHPTRRDVLKSVAVGATGVVLSPFLSRCASPSLAFDKKKNVLFFTKSGDFPHDVVTRKPGEPLAFAEKVFQDFVAPAAYNVTISKDGTILSPDRLGEFDAFVFYTTGDLTKPPGTKYKSDQTPAMPPAGKAALLDAIASGKGFLGLHCASDTFHSPGYVAAQKTKFLRPANPGDAVDPYIAMLGGEFNSHGSQQNATIRVGSSTFPGLTDQLEFAFTEEWYSFYNLAPDLHVILVQDTSTMQVNGKPEWQYQRDPYPETWARRHGLGRAFYSSMGHRNDVWTNPIFQKVVLAGLAWTSGRVNADVPPNLTQACPQLARELT